ncbi:MAG: heme o synthase [Polyangiales bacterium]
MRVQTLPRPLSATLSDYISLTKPRITTMVVLTAAGGMWLAPGSIDPASAVGTLLTIALVVAAANALNCYLERDSDRLMQRTARRPLPDQRLNPTSALWFGAALGVIAVTALGILANPLTGVLGALALLSYVLVYTPMKKITPQALLVGAIPGALPPLMGWTAATNQIQLPGVLLFALMFFWQIPHFIAISIFRQEEYDRAGLKVYPSVLGLRIAKRDSFLYALLLFASSVAVYATGMSGLLYLVLATGLGLWFVGTAARGFWAKDDLVWSKKLFVVSLVYISVLFPALIFDAV